MSRLVSLGRAAGIQQQHIAAELGLGAKAGPTRVSAWVAGTAIPNVGHTCGWSRAVGYRAVVQRDGTVIGDFLDVWPTAGQLREAAGLSRADVAACLYVQNSWAHEVEQKAGPRTRLTTAVQYLGVLGCEITLEPLGEEETA
ncbi:hypothetical protein OIE13_22665 [Streptosporangium sp. NBC_01810]|uniref:hypothetical protein n=1 Tax=Streptosporangium sp. NBC_01810 TaxID=2975951 RepID=UPI002DD96B64|nr:hypothetical protein [Streptosporangium sp. NBC_01810]WSA23748.1 hypothetical protein OIE13_22665 [Streptosporangium sp. NBC_01810]